MQIIRTEQQWNIIFIETCNLYKGIIDKIFEKTIGKANNKAFAKNYFLEYVEAELEFFNGFPFNKMLISYFDLYYNMGFTWAKFFKEIRILKEIHTYDVSNTSAEEYFRLGVEFTTQEVKHIVIESKLLQEGKPEASIYNIVQCVLLNKRREIDFVKYIAKYKTICAFVDSLRNSKENNIEKNTSSIRIFNESVRWNGAKGKKIELIRLLVALNDCKYFETDKGLIPSQEQVMNYFGEMLSVNLKHYEQDLSNGFESKLQTNTAVFDKLKQAIEKRFQLKVEQLG